MGKKVFDILYVILVAIFASCIAVSIAIAVVASIAALSQEEDEGCARSEKGDFFCCNDLKTKILRRQVGLFLNECISTLET